MVRLRPQSRGRLITRRQARTRGKPSATSFGLRPDEFPLPPNDNVFRLGPDLTWDLDLFGGERRHIEQERALAAVQQGRLAAAYMTLTSDAVTDTIALARAESELAAVEQILAIDRQDLDLVERERDAGTVPDSDVILTEAQVAADAPLEPPLRQEASVTRHALAALGRPRARPLGAARSRPRGPAAAARDPARPAIGTAASPPRHPAAEAQLHADSAAIGAATAQLYPDVTLSAGVSAAPPDPGHLFTPSALVGSIAAGLTRPVFDGDTRRARRQAAIAAFRAPADTYRQTVLDVFREVADRLEALVHDGEAACDERRSLAVASESVKLQQVNHAAGGTGLLNLLDAQRNDQQAARGALRAEGARFTDTALLLAAMGGGWWDALVLASAGRRGAVGESMARRYYEGPVSDHYDGERFFNPGQAAPVRLKRSRMLRWMLRREPIPWPRSVPVTPARPEARVDGVRITGVGHSTLLIQAGGRNLLTDPVWSKRASPFRLAGPRRVTAPGIAFADLPPIDAVLLSHCHYDHLDLATLKRLHARHAPLIAMPLGTDTIIRDAIPDARVVVGDWFDRLELGAGLATTLTPANHWAARWPSDARRMLWCGHFLETGAGTIWFAGDTAYGDGAIFPAIRARLGAPDMALIPIGAYEPRGFMRSSHTNPEEAVRIMQDVGATRAIGIHWGTFRLSSEAWEAPRADLGAALDAAGIARERFVAAEPGRVM